jgi:hypothetical protein
MTAQAVRVTDAKRFVVSTLPFDSIVVSFVVNAGRDLSFN